MIAIPPASAHANAQIRVVPPCVDKASFLAVVAAALHFPDYFGYNWDALADCLGDALQGGGGENDDGAGNNRGLIVLFEDVSTFASQHPEDFAVAVEILRGAVEERAERGGVALPLCLFLLGLRADCYLEGEEEGLLASVAL